MRKKNKPQEGDVISIDIENNVVGFGRVLKNPLVAFYDIFRSDAKSIRIDEVIKSKVLFTIFVANRAFNSKKWTIIGNEVLESELMVAPKFFKQDSISKKFYIYDPIQDIPVEKRDCVGLERAAVWDPEHVEDRLRDSHAGVSNKWVESLKLPHI